MSDQKIKIMNEHRKRDDLVFRFFKEVSEETNTIIAKDKNGNDLISQRVQVITTFSLIDVLASYWYKYQGITGRTNERAQSWYDSYCATDRNEDYKDLWRELSSNRLYKFRNALVHFFGLGEQDKELFISICPNNIPEEKRKKWEKGFLENGNKTLIIKPRHFSNLVRKGAILMFEDWKGIINDAQNNRETEKKHIDGIQRVWEKVNKEGAVRVDEKNNNSN